MKLFASAYWALVFGALILFADSAFCQTFLTVSSANQARSTEPRKISPWLQDETSEWLQTDPSHKISVILFIDESCLDNQGASQTHVADMLVAEYDTTIEMVGKGIGCIIADIPASAIEQLAEQTFVESLWSGKYPKYHILPDELRTLSSEVQESSDTYANTSLENSVASIDAPRVWRMGYRGQGMKIAIIDTGINKTLPDGNPRPDLLFPNGTSKVCYEEDCIDGSDTRDFYGISGHGTWVAITAAGSGLYNFSSPSLNITSEGVAPDALIMNYKVFLANGSADPSWIVRGIDHAVENGSDVINISIGDPTGTPTDLVSQAADRAVSRGVVVVVCAGNSGPGFGTIESPGCAFNVTTVGMVAANNTPSIRDDVLHPNSSRGPTTDGRIKPDVVAPGVAQVYLRYINGSSPDYISKSGTSFAAPHTSGAAALVRQAHPDWEPLMVKDALMRSARLNDYLALLYELARGKGIVDTYGAILNATPADFSVVSIDPIEPHYPVFQVYHGGMWLNGIPITMDYSVRVRREPAYANPGVLQAIVCLKRTNRNVPVEEKILDSATVLLVVGQEAILVLNWNETETMQAGNWTISGFVEPFDEGYFDGWPEDNSKNADVVEAKELVGDVDGTGIVDVLDAIRVAMAFNSHIGEPRWNPDADLNKDGVVDIYDCILLAIHFGESVTDPVPPRSGAGMESVATGPAISVDPSQLVVFKGEVFTVSVKITDVVDLRGWEFKLYWNRTILNCTNITVQTPAEWQNNTQNYAPGLEANYNTTHARFWKAQSANYPAPSFNGSMTIVTLTFQAMQPGTTGLTMADAKLGNSTAQPITCIVSSGSVSVHYGRYMRSDTHTINGLNAYRLSIPQSASSAVYSKSGSGEGASWGIRAWIRHSSGVEQEISLDGQTGTPKALVYRYSGSGILSSTVSVTQTALQSTDSLVVRVYVRIGEGSWNLCATFTTERLQSTTLTGVTWTVYYYTYAYYSYKYDTTATKFYWGTTTYNSRIQNLRYT